MNWNSHEFIWLDWTILAVGIVAVIWAVWRSVQKDKRSQQGASSEDYLFGKGEPWYIICLLYTSPSPRDRQKSRMPSSA